MRLVRLALFGAALAAAAPACTTDGGSRLLHRPESASRPRAASIPSDVGSSFLSHGRSIDVNVDRRLPVHAGGPEPVRRPATTRRRRSRHLRPGRRRLARRSRQRRAATATDLPPDASRAASSRAAPPASASRSSRAMTLDDDRRGSAPTTSQSRRRSRCSAPPTARTSRRSRTSTTSTSVAAASRRPRRRVRGHPAGTAVRQGATVRHLPGRRGRHCCAWTRSAISSARRTAPTDV